MSTYNFNDRSLTMQQIAEQLNETGVFPPKPDERYPLFPDALIEVEEKATTTCWSCHAHGFYYPADRAYAPGHCYSQLGMTEYTSISLICEWCFDTLTTEPDEGEDEHVAYNDDIDDSHARMEDAMNHELDDIKSGEFDDLLRDL